MSNHSSAAVPTADDILRGVDLAGRTAIVTGSSSGVGVAIASALAKAGAEVTLAVRDVAAGAQTADAIAAATDGRTRPSVEAVDLLSMESVRAFTARWGERRPIDLLVNNAGLMGPPLTRTKDGFESQMAVK